MKYGGGAGRRHGRAAVRAGRRPGLGEDDLWRDHGIALRYGEEADPGRVLLDGGEVDPGRDHDRALLDCEEDDTGTEALPVVDEYCGGA